MHHLQPAAEALDAAADETFASGRQRAREIFMPAVEEDELDHRAFVGAAHAPRRPRIATRHVIEHIHHDGGDVALGGFGKGGFKRAVDQPGRQMEEKIDEPLAGGFADQRRELGTHAVERADIAKERKQNRRPHRRELEHNRITLNLLLPRKKLSCRRPSFAAS
jgi:hypothetical protein